MHQPENWHDATSAVAFGDLAPLHSHFANTSFGSHNTPISGSLRCTRSPKFFTSLGTSDMSVTLSEIAGDGKIYMFADE